MRLMAKENNFYNDFDVETWGGPRIGDYRTPFQQDRDRIIHTSAFRRLQAKTQVFLAGEYDFYRTRLTHSLEVAQVGRSICSSIKRKEKCGSALSKDFFIDPDLVEAICLAHDLGHPPFGHAGERGLHRLMTPYGGFEGNAQTLRLLTETIYSNGPERAGMQPTRAFMDGVLKYKTVRHFTPEAKNHYLYDEQGVFVDFVFSNLIPPKALTPGPQLNSFRSLECQIMDWADNTAYSLHDLADSIQAGFLRAQKVEKWARDNAQKGPRARIVEGLLKMMRTGPVTLHISKKIGTFIDGCTVKKRSNFMSNCTNRYRYELVIAPEVQTEYEVFSELARTLVFKSPQLHQLEHKGNYMLERVFGVLENNYIKSAKDYNLLPSDLEVLMGREKNNNARARLLCDHISGMTDGFAERTFRRLFDPTYGSIVDLV
jgi:dGTPase